MRDWFRGVMGAIAVGMLVLSTLATMVPSGLAATSFDHLTPEELYRQADRMRPNYLSVLSFFGLGRTTPNNRRDDLLHVSERAMSTSSRRISTAEVAETEQKLLYLRTAVESGEQPWSELGTIKLGQTLYALERWDEAVTMLERGMEAVGNGYPAESVAIPLSRAYAFLGQLDQAEATIRRALSFEQSVYLDYALAEWLRMQGRPSEAAEVYAQIALHEETPDFFRPMLQERAERMIRAESLASFIGTVTLNGVGLPGVEVLVTPQSSYVSSAPESEMETLTNANGEFWVYGLPEGDYRLELLLPLDSVAGAEVLSDVWNFTTVPGQTMTANVRFESPPVITSAHFEAADPYPILHLEWEPHAKLSEYELALRLSEGRMTMGFELLGWQDMLTSETSASIPLPESYARRGWGTNNEGDMILSPFFGIYAPLAEVSVGFTKGDIISTAPPTARGVLFASDAPGGIVLEPLPYPFTEADELLIERRYEEAIAAYQRRLEDDPADMHSLIVLATIARYGVDRYGTHQDPEMAARYIDSLAELGVIFR